jgi:hypothetical protein
MDGFGTQPFSYERSADNGGPERTCWGTAAIVVMI